MSSQAKLSVSKRLLLSGRNSILRSVQTRRALSTTRFLSQQTQNSNEPALSQVSNNELNSIPSNITDFGAYWRKDKLEPIPVSEAAKSPSLIALQARLKLTNLVPLDTLARTLICQSAHSKYLDNLSMASFGKNLLNFYIYEHFMVKYPRLTPVVLQQVSDIFLSTSSLAEVALSWGVEEDSRSALERYLEDGPSIDLNGVDSEGAPTLIANTNNLFGKLRYSPSSVRRENGVVELLSGNDIQHGRNGALATFVRALVSAIYSHNDLATTQTFIHEYIIKPKKIDLSSLLVFEQPTRELSRLCAREGLKAPVSRLLVESGRLSSHPVFVVGVFSGSDKLGEGQGASLVEAKTRAAVNALKGWYLFSPLDAQLPSSTSETEEFKGAYVDSGSVIV